MNGKDLCNMDAFLGELGLVRKAIAKDGSCIFRAVSEKLFASQSHHAVVKQKYLEHVSEQATNYRSEQPGIMEMIVLSKIYKLEFFVFHSLVPEPFNVTQNNYSKKIRLCYTGGNQYDLVYTKAEVQMTAVCQSVLYEMLYRDVFGLDSELDEAVLFLELQKELPRNRGIKDCFLSDIISLFGVDKADPLKKVCGRSSPPVPFRIAKALHPALFRNVELDIVQEEKREARLQGLGVSSGFSPGDKCQVVLDEQNEHPYNAHIQSINEEGGTVLVFIEELGVKKTVSAKSILPLPLNISTLGSSSFLPVTNIDFLQYLKKRRRRRFPRVMPVAIVAGHVTPSPHRGRTISTTSTGSSNGSSKDNHHHHSNENNNVSCSSQSNRIDSSADEHVNQKVNYHINDCIYDLKVLGCGEVYNQINYHSNINTTFNSNSNTDNRYSTSSNNPESSLYNTNQRSLNNWNNSESVNHLQYIVSNQTQQQYHLATTSNNCSNIIGGEGVPGLAPVTTVYTGPVADSFSPVFQDGQLSYSDYQMTAVENCGSVEGCPVPLAYTAPGSTQVLDNVSPPSLNLTGVNSTTTIPNIGGSGTAGEHFSPAPAQLPTMSTAVGGPSPHHQHHVNPQQQQQGGYWMPLMAVPYSPGTQCSTTPTGMSWSPPPLQQQDTLPKDVQQTDVNCLRFVSNPGVEYYRVSPGGQPGPVYPPPGVMYTPSPGNPTPVEIPGTAVMVDASGNHHYTSVVYQPQDLNLDPSGMCLGQQVMLMAVPAGAPGTFQQQPLLVSPSCPVPVQ